MKRVYLLVFLLFAGFTFQQAFCQNLKENEMVIIQGKKYVLYEVKKGETLFSLSRKFQVGIPELTESNPQLAQGLKTGDVLKIPLNEQATDEKTVSVNDKPAKKEVQGDEKYIIHEIKRRETPYFVAKKYGISIDDIYRCNPGLKKFSKGLKIKIPQSGGVPETLPEPAVTSVKNTANEEFISHKVKPDETLYSISRKYGCTVDRILELNPSAKNPRIGMELKIPVPATSAGAVVAKPASGSFVTHKIEPGETLFGIMKKYNVTRDELVKLNPQLETGFPAGAVIKIQAKDGSPADKKIQSESGLEKHTVSKGETLYKISSEYNVPVSDLKKYNPSLEGRDGLQAGEIILVPSARDNVIPEQEQVPGNLKRGDVSSQDDLPLNTPEQCRHGKNGKLFFETYNVALLLPLYIDDNIAMNTTPAPVSDTLNIDEWLSHTEEEPDTVEVEVDSVAPTRKFYKNSENFIHFYEGAILAVDSMKRAGMNIRLSVYDTQRSQSVVDKIIHSDEFMQVDLIIGPIFPEEQKPASDFSAKNNIPMISPLSADGKSLLEKNDNYFQINPSRDFILQETANYVADEFAGDNIVIFHAGGSNDPQEGKLAELCRSKVSGQKSTTVHDYNGSGRSGLENVLSKQKENIILLPSDKEGDVSVAISNLCNKTQEYNITLVGTNRLFQFESIGLEPFHQLNFHYLYPYWPDFSSPSTGLFYKKFRDTFYAEPNPFSLQGYDATFFFLNALWNSGKNFYDCLPYMRPSLIQGKYKFVKVSQFGGYMNHGVSVITYGRDYNVTRKFVR